MRIRTQLAGFLLTTLLFLIPAQVPAQPFPGFGSLEARVGTVLPKDANAGFSGSVDLGLGYLGSPLLRAIIGFNYFTADVDREETVFPAEGSFSAAGGRIGLRLDPFGAEQFTPYLVGAITGHSVNTDADDTVNEEALDELYGDFIVGGSIGAGITYALDEFARYAVTAEGRRVFATDIGHWAAEVGFRINPRGRNAYLAAVEPVEVAPLPAEVGESRELAAERERLAAARDTLEVRRLEVERERLAREAEAEGALREQEAELLRQRADTLAVAAQREAEARARAEAEAAQARAEAEAARLAAAAAEQRAMAAEQQLYDALLDLDRLIANITEIRESERGLAIVLGQGLFASGQASLSPPTRDEVGRIAAVLQQFPDQQIVVEGHTDAVGSEVTNQRLSEQRSEAVRAALIASGVNPGRITAIGYGESQPIATNETAEGRAQNRRVEIVIVGARRPGR